MGLSVEIGDRYTALLAACNYGHVEVARLLWTMAPTSTAAWDGERADGGVLSLIQNQSGFIIRARRGPQRKDGGGYTALLCAASQAGQSAPCCSWSEASRSRRRIGTATRHLASRRLVAMLP